MSTIDIRGVSRNTDGTEQKDDSDNTLTTTGKEINNLVAGDIVVYKFITDETKVLTSEEGNTIEVTTDRYVELRLLNTSSKGQLQYRFAVEMTPTNNAT